MLQGNTHVKEFDKHLSEEENIYQPKVKELGYPFPEDITQETPKAGFERKFHFFTKRNHWPTALSLNQIYQEKQLASLFKPAEFKATEKSKLCDGIPIRELNIANEQGMLIFLIN